MNFIEQYKEIKQHYHVPHLINEHKRVLFVLESPHIDELLQQTPVSGKSGKSMTKTLFPSHEQALGIKLREEPENIVGIINICSIPMQESAYINEKVVTKYNQTPTATTDFFKALESIRIHPRPTHNIEAVNELQTAILNDFKEEMRKLEKQTLLIIPCGKTAATFLNIAGVSSPNWTVLNNIPHPSFNQWYRSTYAELIFDMRLRINDIYLESRAIVQPHEILQLLIDEQALCIEQLAFTLEEEHLADVIEGKITISNELAEKLKKHFAIHTKHWGI